MRIYFDNVIVSARVRRDLNPAEQAALDRIEAAHDAGTLKRVTSRASWREQERTRDAAKRAALDAARGEVSIVARDNEIQGFSHLTDRRGGTTVLSPILTDIVDEPLFADLRRIGLKDRDARHLMYAVANDCDRFITTDPDFLDRRADLEARCGNLRIRKPSELTTELGL